jgi:hypothetical protein
VCHIDLPLVGATDIVHHLQLITWSGVGDTEYMQIFRLSGETDTPLINLRSPLQI